jgi:hypothetical protein
MAKWRNGGMGGKVWAGWHSSYSIHFMSRIRPGKKEDVTDLRPIGRRTTTLAASPRNRRAPDAPPPSNLTLGPSELRRLGQGWARLDQGLGLHNAAQSTTYYLVRSK